MRNYWEEARNLRIQTGAQIVGGFDVDFHGNIPEETKDELMRFVYWVEDHFHLPVTLWVDFHDKHYFVHDGKRVAYRFYWVDYPAITSFENFDDIPVIELPVLCAKRSQDDLLRAFVQAITHYFAWLCGENMHTFKPDEKLNDEILQAYYHFRGE